VRKGHRQDSVEIGAIAEPFARLTAVAHLGAGAGGTGGTMVSVGDVEGRHPRERPNQRVAIGSGHWPQRVSHAICRLEIDERWRGHDPCGDGIDVRGGLMNQENGTGLGAQRLDVAGAIVFLVAARPFVLLDHAGVVFRQREARRQTELLMRAHPQAIEIDARLVVEHQGVGLQPAEVGGRARVDLISIWIGPRRQLDLGA
jgi:hypothetical protein